MIRRSSSFGIALWTALAALLGGFWNSQPASGRVENHSASEDIATPIRTTLQQESEEDLLLFRSRPDPNFLQCTLSYLRSRMDHPNPEVQAAASAALLLWTVLEEDHTRVVDVFARSKDFLDRIELLRAFGVAARPIDEETRRKLIEASAKMGIREIAETLLQPKHLSVQTCP